ncbi:hypothetical protein LTR91_000809 [Friedmanniomyces endolithicus]|uniref:DUF1772 domain-containing protein n=1 Tax=Friedmanniomyces endolithicus TaxID=329885 RepID=A0AAN6L1H3_9PEZI|nr:hypothetical protein LTR94_001784 [Friedmanniomyces endolithicus]KAK0797570.1 hypothetical protein LTR59_006775 [Friedmanniomyces endolithicus]KAK0817154.1 hypothetical protein LTR38_001790 [Friedmanniomyces endolithicus]KAK0819949.1 hypothetical protein LTR75_001977 [Friedmanniomyces endolithicus]KAK0834169.1 hypothetical protein LTR03_014551 [Friedmanniomyces endolithicus]
MSATMSHSLALFSIVASSFTAGAKLAWSLVSFPALLGTLDSIPEAAALDIWYHTFDHGFLMVAPLTLLSGVVCLVNAYLTHTRGSDSTSTGLLFLAGLANIGITPFTFAFGVDVNAELHLRRATHGKKDTSHDARLRSGVRGTTPSQQALGVASTAEVLRRWALLNGVRALLPLTGALLVCGCLLLEV